MFEYINRIKKEILTYNVLMYLVFSFSAILILILAIKNNGSANDDHLEVCRIIFNTRQLPVTADCWQCYQPKLYHYSIVQLWKLFGADGQQGQIIIAQLFNAVAGIITLFIILIFIKKQLFKGYVKLLAFAFIALNPRLISISVQPSNDALIILLGTLIIYFLYKFLLQSKAIYFVLSIFFSILAGFTKLSAAILIVGVIVVLCLKIISDKNFALSLKKGYLGWLILYVLSTTACFAIFGDYYKNYKEHGQLVVYNTPYGDLPHLYKETVFRRAGVKSILGGYFTFRIIDMLEYPKINDDELSYRLHRTSVWSQLYGRTHFLYFDGWPPGIWSQTSSGISAVGRVTLALALIPSILFLLGIFKEMKLWGIAILKKRFDFLKQNINWIFHIFFAGFVCFIIVFTLRGRDFSFMKIIYLFPGILAATIPLLKGFEIAHAYMLKNKYIAVLFNLTMITLLIYYVIPIFYLISKLSGV